MAVILFKVMLAVACGLLGAWALRSRLAELPERAFLRGAVALQLITALGMFVAFYVVGHQEPTSDVPGYYVPAARAALAGQVPFRDFALSYAPLFAYVGAALVFVWNSTKVFALFVILLNAVALVWWHRAASACFDRPTVRQCTILYATSGHVLVQALLGTNQAWVSAALAASALLIVHERSAASGLVQAAAACTTKVLAHLFWPVLWICAPQRSRWAAAAILPTVAVYAAFVAIGAGTGLLYPLRHEGDLISSGNLPYLLDLALSASPFERVLFDTLALAALGVTTAWLYMVARTMSVHDRRALLFAGLALTGLVFMLFSKKSITGYVIFVMYPIALMLVSGMATVRARVGFMLVFNVLLVAEPSLWFHLEGYHWPLRTWFAMGGGSAAAAFVLLDLALLACYVYVAWLSVRAVRRTQAARRVTIDGSSMPRSCRAT